jgi:hypothetical protein
MAHSHFQQAFPLNLSTIEFVAGQQTSHIRGPLVFHLTRLLRECISLLLMQDFLLQVILSFRSLWTPIRMVQPCCPLVTGTVTGSTMLLAESEKRQATGAYIPTREFLLMDHCLVMFRPHQRDRHHQFQLDAIGSFPRDLRL